MPEDGELSRLRVHYGRGPELRYVGNLDMQLVWERTLRRARVPVAFTQGFNPRPRFHIAAALPLGFTSICELLDLWLTERLEPSEISGRLQRAAPPGLRIQTCEYVPLASPALQTRVQAAGYCAVLRKMPPDFDLARSVSRLLAAPAIQRERRGQAYDLRPLILDLKPLPLSDPPGLEMLLSAREGATGRPEEVLAALDLEPSSARVERIDLYLTPDKTPGPV